MRGEERGGEEGRRGEERREGKEAWEKAVMVSQGKYVKERRKCKSFQMQKNKASRPDSYVGSCLSNQNVASTMNNCS